MLGGRRSGGSVGGVSGSVGLGGDTLAGRDGVGFDGGDLAPVLGGVGWGEEYAFGNDAVFVGDVGGLGKEIAFGGYEYLYGEIIYGHMYGGV